MLITSKYLEKINQIPGVKDTTPYLGQCYYWISAKIHELFRSNDAVAADLYQGLKDKKITPSSLRFYSTEQLTALKVKVNQSSETDQTLLKVFQTACCQAHYHNQSVTRQVALLDLYNCEYTKLAQKMIAFKNSDSIEQLTAKLFSEVFYDCDRSHILQLFQNLPENDQQDALFLYNSSESKEDFEKVLGNLFYFDGPERIKIVKVLKKLTPDQQKQFISFLPLQSVCTTELCQYLQQLDGNAVIETTKDFNSLLESASYFKDLDPSVIKAFVAMKPEQRRNLVHNIEQQSKQVKIPIAADTLFLLVTQIPNQESLDLFISALTKDHCDEHTVKCFLDDLELIPPEFHDTVIEYFADSTIRDPFLFCSGLVIDCIDENLLSEDQFYDFFTESLMRYQENPELAKKICHNCHLFYMLDDVEELLNLKNETEALLSIEPDKVAKLEYYTKQLSNSYSRNEKVRIMKALDSFSDKELKHIVPQIKTCIKDEKNIAPVLQIIEIFSEVDLEARKQFAKQAVALSKNLSSSEDVISVLTTFSSFDQSDWESVFKAIKPFLNTKNYERDLFIDVINELEITEKEDWESLSESLSILYNKSKYEDIHAKVFKTILNIPKNQRQDTITTLKTFSTKYSLEIEDIVLVRLARLLAPIENSEDLNAIVPIIINHLEENKEFLTFLKLLECLPHYKRIESLATLDPDDDLDEDGAAYFFEQIFTHEAVITIKEIQAHLQSQLKSTSSDIRLQKLLTNVIRNYSEALQIADDSPLFQEAIQIALQLDPDALKDNKNPYTLFSELKKTQETEAIIPAQAIEMKAQTVAEKSIIFDLEKIRENASKKWGYTFSELPTGITFEKLKELFDSIKNRVEGNSQAKKYIKENFLSPLDGLYDELFNKPLFKYLFSLKGDPEQTVEHAAYHLYKIIEVLFSYDTKIPKNEFFSDRDKFLLSLASQIKDCSVGQKDGLSLIFNNLVIRQEIKDAISTDEDFPLECKKQLYALFQAMLNQQLTSASLLEELTGEDDIEQLSHHALFLRNRFFKQLGLTWTLSFDQHSCVLIDKMFDIESLTVIEKVYKTLDAENLTTQAQRYIETLLTQAEKKEPIYNKVHAYFEKIENKPDDWQECFLEFDDDFQFTGITKEGAVTLLIDAGIFKTT